MNIEELRKLKNKSIAQQNALMFLEMKMCAQKAASIVWLGDLLARNGQQLNRGILILLSDIPDQAGTLWYGTWLADDQSFYEFVVATTRDGKQILDIESWVKATPEVSAHKKGIGKTPAYIALELLSATKS